LSVRSALIVLAACASSPPQPPGAVSSSIAMVVSQLAVVDPDQGTVSFVDPDSLALLAQVPVGGEPHDLLVVGNELWVSTFRGGEVVVIDPASASIVRSAPVCAGPRGMATDGRAVVVACEWSGTVVSVDVESLAATELASNLVRPRAIAIAGGSTYVGEYTGGDVVELPSRQSISLVPSSAPYRPALAAMTANLVEAIVPAFGELHVAHELVNHTGDTSETVADDYGSVLDDDPKINPAVTTLSSDAPVLYAKFDGSTRAASGPVAIAPMASRYLLVANISSNNVAVVDTQASSPDLREVASFAVGAGPSGIAVDNDRAFVDNAFDGSISVLDLSQPFDGETAPRYPARATLVRTQTPMYSAAALAGRRLFYDATNPHVTPSGVLACATCHPSGLDDGLVWFVHTSQIPTKRRRTPSLANAHTGTAPYHWDGQFAAMDALVDATITELMAGDGLLVDTSSVQAYVDEIVRAPVAPPGDPARLARGGAIFTSASAGCAGCHVSPLGTDGKLWSVLSPMSLDSDDVVAQTNTPALAGVFQLAPYFHDGRSSDLLDALTRSDASQHGSVAGLSPADLDDLVAYLRSL
jgi:DNA-binding beta-propeller fold protein YncE